MKILMVCLGNICRSPLAEGILKEKIKQHRLDWEVDSAGTGYWHVGDGPDRRSVAVARQNGIDIRAQRARQISPKDLDDFDLIFAMDTSNYRNLINLAAQPDLSEKVHLILDLVFPGEGRSVPDPYYDDQGFEGVFEMLDEACDRIVERWNKL
ncbi:MAG: low molecular weight phosphotyrosine protein phosphatase [Saprospirales bacterium]|nr:low molecular weight phosphotyrosine protein phosphatase [Saprospirales bacterium]MBK8491264.1 low molecular weight phosphotyrosine protein phosphatase [Saprospirales bacterium]